LTRRVAIGNYILEILTIQRELVRKFYYKLKNFKKFNHDDIVDKIVNDFDNKEDILREFYGGGKQHSYHAFNEDKENNNFTCKKFDFSNAKPLASTQVDLNNNIIIDNVTSFSQSHKFNEQHATGLLTRPCDNKCYIPALWASKLFKSISNFTLSYSFEKTIANFAEFEICVNCDQNNNLCTIDTCFNMLKCLNTIAVHYTKLRTFTRKFYTIRAIFNSIFYYQNILLSGNLDLLINAVKSESIDVNNNTKANLTGKISPDLKCDLKLFATLFKEYQDEMNNLLFIKICSSCNRFTLADKVIQLEASDYDFPIVHKLGIQFDPYTTHFICKAYCEKFIFKDSINPPISVLNNMQFKKPPECIAKLNIWERILIQKARCFQTIGKLNPVSKWKGQNVISALRGLAIHLPLALHETYSYVKTTLPSSDNLSIFVHSLPTNANKIWRSLVDLNNVKTALFWLKDNNKEYKDIHVAEDMFSSISSHNDINFTKKDDENVTECDSNLPYHHKSMLRVSDTEVIQQYTVLDLDKVNENIDDIQKYTAERNKAKIMSNHEKNLDHWCFPELFPYGTGGMYDDRESKVNPAMYVRHGMWNASSDLRRNQQYLFSAIHNKDVRAIDSGIYASLHSTSCHNYTALDIKKGSHEKDQKLENSLKMTMKAVRNSKEFWASIRSDLSALGESEGPASFYFTFSPAEYHWEDLFEFLKKINKDININQSMTFNQLLAIDPVGVSIFFDYKFRTFFNTFINNKNGPFGKPKHYFFRREYQMRGTQHMHGLLWVHNCPIIGRDDDDKVIDFIDRHITCRIPDPLTEPLLYDYIMKYQVHRCTTSCTRSVFKNNSIKTFCRYGFPRPIRAHTVLNSAETVIKSRRSGNKPTRLYELRRTREEQYICDYHPILTMAWGGNSDWQFVGDFSMVLDRYITGYISKAEKNSSAALWNEVNAFSSVAGKLKSCALKSFKSREIGIYEAADKLLGFNMYQFSTKVEYLNALPKVQRYKSVKSYKEIKNLDDGDKNIYNSNVIDDHYPNRPTQLESMCLFQFFQWYEIKYEPCRQNQNHTECFKLQNRNAYIHKRCFQPKILKIPTIKVTNKKSSEAYFYQLLLLFLPFRNECDLLGYKTNYMDAYFDALAKKILNLDLLTVFENNRTRVSDAMEKLNMILNLKEYRDNDFSEPDLQDQNNGANLGVNDIVMDNISSLEVQAMVAKLNSEQVSLYNYTISSIKSQKENTNAQSVPPIRAYCSGVGGEF
jgi:hypothetical protein